MDTNDKKENADENSEIVEKEKRKFNHNYISVIILYVFSVLFLIESRKITIFDSALFPYIVSGFSIFIATIILIRTRLKRGDKEEFDFEGTPGAIKFALAMAIYAVGCYYIGFYISTIIFLMASMYLLKQRNYKTMIAISILTPVIIYIFFDLLLDLRIPAGILFG